MRFRQPDLFLSPTRARPVPQDAAQARGAVRALSPGARRPARPRPTARAIPARLMPSRSTQVQAAPGLAMKPQSQLQLQPQSQLQPRQPAPLNGLQVVDDSDAIEVTRPVLPCGAADPRLPKRPSPARLQRAALLAA